MVGSLLSLLQRCTSQEARILISQPINYIYKFVLPAPLLLLLLTPLHIKSDERIIMNRNSYDEGHLYADSVAEQEAYENYQAVARISHLTNKISEAKALVGSHGGSCVVFARNFSRVGIKGNAWDIQPNQTEPALLSVVVYTSHVAVVLGYTDTTLFIVESNYAFDEIISTRNVSRLDPTLRGYFY